MMESYRRHVLVCTGGYCSPNRGGRELYALLPELLEREGMLFGPDRVKRGETPCLGAIDVQYGGHRRRALGARAANPDFWAVGELAAVENVFRHRPETRSSGLSAQS